MRKFPWLEDLDSIVYCPTCRKQIDDFWRGDSDNLDTFNPEFCPYCGQHLDWTKTIPYGMVEEHEEESDMASMKEAIAELKKEFDRAKGEIAKLQGKREGLDERCTVLSALIDDLGENNA